MVAIREHLALAAHHPIEPTRHADPEPLHRRRERLMTTGLDDEMDMVPLDRELAEARADLDPGDGEGPPDDIERPTAAQVPDVREHAHGDVDRKPAGKARPPRVRHARAVALGLAPGPTPLAAVRAEYERGLPTRRHDSA